MDAAQLRLEPVPVTEPRAGVHESVHAGRAARAADRPERLRRNLVDLSLEARPGDEAMAALDLERWLYPLEGRRHLDVMSNDGGNPVRLRQTVGEWDAVRSARLHLAVTGDFSRSWSCVSMIVLGTFASVHPNALNPQWLTWRISVHAQRERSLEFTYERL